MKQYKELLKYILENGVKTEDRTGVGTISVFGYQTRFNLQEGFPIVTSKRIPFRWVVEELLWFLRGDTYEPNLSAKGVDIWKEWATKEQCAKFERSEGELGPIYGHQWRNFNDEFDQIKWLINEIQTNPNSRRLIVTGWNPIDAEQVALPPCHTLFQFNVKNETLSCQLYQRSADAFLGVPFNIASYALLTHMIAHVCNLKVGDFIHTFGDLHIYLNHLDQVAELLSREPYELPTLDICEFKKGTGFDGLLDLKYDDLILNNYKHHPTITAEVAV